MSHAIRVLVEREVAHDCFNPAHHGPCEVCDAVAELSRRDELTERLAAWQQKTGGVALFFADGRVVLEWFEADLRTVEGAGLGLALDAAGEP